ncbi:AlpA family phage regulatory protein [Vibrio rumoiensis]|uniref:AlpA family phage regulatory protein n=1 Tax=Vibrio rumoiensis TaxID=76258 RepID=UPI003AA9B9A8
MQLIRLKEVTALTSLSRSSIYKFISEGRFPKSVSLGDRAVAWIKEEIEEWIEARIAERDER